MKKLRHCRPMYKRYYQYISAIFGKVGRISSEEVVLQLVKSKCLPVLLYCLEVCPLTKNDVKSSDFVRNRFFMKFFRTSTTETVKNMPVAVLVRFTKCRCWETHQKIL